MNYFKQGLALIIISMTLLATNVHAETDKNSKVIFDSLIKQFKANNIQIADEATDTKTRPDGNVSLKLTTKEFLSISVTIFSSKDEAQKEEADMAKKIKEHPEMADMLGFARNDNLILTTVLMMPDQIEKSKTVVKVFLGFKK